MIEKIRSFIEKHGKQFLEKIDIDAKTACKYALAVVVILYIVLFLWDWQNEGKPNLPELRSFALVIGTWAF